MGSIIGLSGIGALVDFEYYSESPEETMRIGAALGSLLVSGDVVGLTGELGAGKTWFVKGVARGCSGVNEHDVTSPTFTIINEYAGRVPVYHCDAYRLAGPGDLENIGFEEYTDGDGITIVEWSEKISGSLPPDRIDVAIGYMSESGRRLVFTGTGDHANAVLSRLAEDCMP